MSEKTANLRKRILPQRIEISWNVVCLKCHDDPMLLLSACLWRTRNAETQPPSDIFDLQARLSAFSLSVRVASCDTGDTHLCGLCLSLRERFFGSLLSWLCLACGSTTLSKHSRCVQHSLVAPRDRSRGSPSLKFCLELAHCIMTHMRLPRCSADLADQDSVYSARVKYAWVHQPGG